MRTLALLLATAFVVPITAHTADDSWNKVKALKSGTELRIYKRGSLVPILAQAAEATDDKLTVVVKKKEVAIDKSEIDRIESRPLASKKVTKTTTTTVVDPTLQPVKGARPEDYPTGATTSSGTSYSWSNVPFETIYRRGIGKPAK
jgi:hypothetical protein